jgi:hypothetical protein
MIRKDGNRPPLSARISADDFENYYWLLSELKEFCRNEGIPGAGGKIELTARIAAYLKGGTVISPPRQTSVTPPRRKQPVEGRISDDTKIPADILLTPTLRAYFEERTNGRFRFSKELIAYLREHPGNTLGDAVTFLSESGRKTRKPVGETVIPPQCQYNRFMRNYRADHPDATFAEAVREWHELKKIRGALKIGS